MEQTTTRKRGGWAAAAAVCALALAAFFLLRSPEPPPPELPPDLDGFTVAALQEDADGIPTTGGFAITSAQPVTTAQLQQMVVLEPHVDVQVAKSSGGTYTVTPAQELRSGSVYNLMLHTADDVRRFAFQTKSTFALEYKMPTGEQVPIETGIELRFTGGRPADPASAFSITPVTAGGFQEIRGTYVFVPEQPLLHGTRYTVTLSAGLASEGGATLGEDISFSFTTREDESVALVRVADPVMETFTPDETPLVELLRSGTGDPGSFDIEVLRYADQSAFLAALRALHEQADAQLSAEHTVLAATFSQRVLEYELSPYETKCFFQLPQPLPDGYYLVRITGVRPDNGQRVTLHKLIQVNDLAVAAMAAGGSYLVWANSTSTGRPVSGATVYLNGTSKAMTNGDGLAVFATPDMTEGEFAGVTVEAGGNPFVVDLAPRAPEVLAGERRYHSALYSDREVYLPTDTIRIWGVVQPRVGSVGPREVTLLLHGERQTVSVGEFGSFTASFALHRSASDYHEIVLEVEGVPTAWRYIRVLEYDKPIYDGSLELDRTVYFPGDAVHLTGAAHFYDGTQADQMRLTLTASLDWQPADTLPVTVEGEGFAAAMAVPEAAGSDWRPQELRYTVRNALAEDAGFERSASALLYPRDAMIEAAVEKDGSAIAVSLHEIDKTKARAGGWFGGGADGVRGAAIDRPVSWTVTRHTWVREQVGSHYDFINKVDVPEYRHSIEDQLLGGSVWQPATGGQITIPLGSYEPEEGSYLEVVVFSTDRAGRPMQETAFVYPGGWNDHLIREQQNNFFLRTAEGAWSATAVLGQRLPLLLWRGGTEVASGRVLLVPVRDTILPASVHPADAIGLTFEQPYLPNIDLYCAYFDGKNPHLAQYPLPVAFDPQQRTLQVELAADKERYSAGEGVALSVRVTDESGAPVEAQVCISVVDEAAFAVGPQDYDLPGALYRSVSTARTDCYISHIDHLVGPEGGEGGEGGSEGFRTEFGDNPAFLNLTTDRSGEATAVFTLGDSLTRWRITALAAAEGPAGGKGMLHVDTGQPFIVSALSAEQVTVHDDIVVSLRGFGDALQRGDPVAFACELQRENGSPVGESLTGSGLPAEYVNFNFGKAEPGLYTLQVVGKSGAHSDSLRLPIRVIHTQVEVPVLRYLQPEELAELRPERYPVEITLVDSALRPWLETLYSLAMRQGARADQQAAYWVAQRLLAGYNGQDGSALPEPTVYSGAVSLLPYSDSDTLLTAKMALIAPETLPGAAEYLRYSLQSAEAAATEVAACYLGLAALKQPVLRDLRLLVETLQPQDDTGFSYGDKLLLVAALAAIGDESGARTAYERLVRPSLTELEDGSLLVQAADPDDALEQTATALVIASLAVRQDAPALARTLISHRSDRVLPVLEQAVYVANTPPAGRELTVSATIGGQQQSIILNRGLAFLTLNKAQLEGAALSGGEDLSLVLRYTGAPDELTDQTDRAATLERTVEPLEGGSLRQSGLVRVTLTPRADGALPSGVYSLLDALPAGMRYVGMEEEPWQAHRNGGWVCAQADGQRLSFRCYLAQGKPLGPLVFYARLVLPGDYRFEAPYLFHAESKAWGTGEPQPLTILP